MNKKGGETMKESFLKAIESDIPINRMIKYRQFIKLDPEKAAEIRDNMEEEALEHGFIGEY